MSITMDNVIVDREIKSCTCIGDVIQLLEVKTKPNTISVIRGFTLYKTWKMANFDDENHASYFILEKDDKLPIIISKKAAQEILKDPEKGITMAYNTWFCRYR